MKMTQTTIENLIIIGNLLVIFLGSIFVSNLSLGEIAFYMRMYVIPSIIYPTLVLIVLLVYKANQHTILLFRISMKSSGGNVHFSANDLLILFSIFIFIHHSLIITEFGISALISLSPALIISIINIYAVSRQSINSTNISVLKYIKGIVKEYKPNDFRVPGEIGTFFISMGILIYLLFILFHIYWIIPLVLVFISGVMVKIRQGQLLGQTVKVSVQLFPEVYDAAETTAERLSMKMPDVFVTQDPVINAYSLGFFGDKSVILNSKTVESMEPNELLFILGHEFSHIRCYHTNLIVITSSSQALKIPVLSNVMELIFLAWSRKAEFTSDRGGLLSCKDLEASFSTLAKIAVGAELYHKLNIDKIFDQITEIDDNFVSRLAELLGSHPYIVKRLHALKQYANSKEYKELSEAGIRKSEDYLRILIKILKKVFNLIFSDSPPTQEEADKDSQKEKTVTDDKEEYVVVACDGCGSKFRIKKNKIKKTNLKAKCPKCGHTFKIG